VPDILPQRDMARVYSAYNVCAPCLVNPVKDSYVPPVPTNCLGHVVMYMYMCALHHGVQHHADAVHTAACQQLPHQLLWLDVLAPSPDAVAHVWCQGMW
jgi:hypothetical protein